MGASATTRVSADELVDHMHLRLADAWSKDTLIKWHEKEFGTEGAAKKKLELAKALIPTPDVAKRLVDKLVKADLDAIVDKAGLAAGMSCRLVAETRKFLKGILAGGSGGGRESGTATAGGRAGPTKKSKGKGKDIDIDAAMRAGDEASEASQATAVAFEKLALVREENRAREDEAMRAVEDAAKATQEATQKAASLTKEVCTALEAERKRVLAAEKELQEAVAEFQRNPPKGKGAPAKRDAMEAISKDKCMSRQTYAQHLRSLLGREELEGQDVFHIIANSKGGADHPDNFLFALNSTFNRSIGDKYDDLNAFLAGQAKTKRAVRASMKWGNELDPRGKPVVKYNPLQHGGSSTDAGDEAKRLIGLGQGLMTHVRHARRTELKR